MSIMKNINKAKVMVLKDQVSYQEGQIVSKTLVQNESVSITLFAFDKGEEIRQTGRLPILRIFPAIRRTARFFPLQSGRGRCVLS